MNPGVACCAICWLAVTGWVLYHLVDIHVRRQRRRVHVRQDRWKQWASPEVQQRIAIAQQVTRLSALARTLEQIHALPERSAVVDE